MSDWRVRAETIVWVSRNQGDIARLPCRTNLTCKRRLVAALTDGANNAASNKVQ